MEAAMEAAIQEEAYYDFDGGVDWRTARARLLASYWESTRQDDSDSGTESGGSMCFGAFPMPADQQWIDLVAGRANAFCRWSKWGWIRGSERNCHGSAPSHAWAHALSFSLDESKPLALALLRALCWRPATAATWQI